MASLTPAVAKNNPAADFATLELLGISTANSLTELHSALKNGAERPASPSLTNRVTPLDSSRANSQSHSSAPSTASSNSSFSVWDLTGLITTIAATIIHVIAPAPSTDAVKSVVEVIVLG